MNLASIMVHEFSRASAIYPIVFLEDTENDRFVPVVLLGLEDGENLFVEDGKWNASYIPAIIRRYPFALAKTGNDDMFTICIDESSEYINEKEGEPLFNDKGEASEAMERVKKYLSELQQMEMFTAKFCEFLKSENMFTPLNMKVKVKDKIQNLSGAYVINEERLNSFSDEKYLELRKNKYINVIFSHLSSLAQIERLLGFKDKSLAVHEEVKDRFEEDKK
jgi:hypothetical protein